MGYSGTFLRPLSKPVLGLLRGGAGPHEERGQRGRGGFAKAEAVRRDLRKDVIGT